MTDGKNIDRLVEIRAGKTGYGILVESDGYISGDLSDGNRRIVREALESRERGEWHIPNPFVLDVVLQKYGIENANKRIYPEEILKREVEKYQKMIADRMALGECYKPDALVLTHDGWRELSEVKEGDEVLTLNTETDTIEIQPVKRKIEHDFSGNLIHIYGRNINDEVTPNHGFPIYDRNHNFKFFKTASELMNDSNLSHYYIPKTGEWREDGSSFFVIDGIKNPSKGNKQCHPDCVNDLVIPMSTFMKFMGIYLSEGDFAKKGNYVNVYQVKEDTCELIDSLFKEMGLPYTKKTYKGKTVFRFSDPRLHEYVKQFGDCYTKYIPSELKKQSKENLRLLYDWFVLGDGRVSGDKRRKSGRLTDDVFSASKQLILDLNEIQLKIGYCGTYHVENRNKDRFIDGRLIESKNTHPLHFTFKSLTSGIYIDKRFINFEEVPYDGKVMCIEVENHTWFVMCNGKSHWTKNCNHPAQSEIDLGRISHNITECHWEGHTLVGKIEFNITEGFRRYGICSSFGDTCANLIINGYKIGVSSRGIGDVVSRLGKNYVNSYELVCFDIVASPSTPGAYIGDYTNLQQYVEGDETRKDSTPLTEKIDKINKLLA